MCVPETITMQTHTASIVPTYLCVKSNLALDVQNCQAFRFLSFYYTHTYSTNRAYADSKPQFEYNIMCTDVVNTANHYKHFSILCPSKLHSSSASLRLCSLLSSSHTQLLLSVLLSPSFFFNCGSFFFCFSWLETQKNFCYIAYLSFHILHVCVWIFFPEATIKHGYLKELGKLIFR